MRPLGTSDPPIAGQYRTVATLGQGGMGRVLLAVSPDGRLVALKLVHAQFVADDGFRARFRREVAASRRVSGAYTAAVIDADPDAPLPWLATVFVPGPSLSEALAAGALFPEESTVRLAAGLASALGEIHRTGLIHRDLKPSNILLTADGLRVIDFGIARATESSATSSLTHTSMMLGSPAFMSPEQAQSQQLTPASDVFALAAVLVAAATGTSPFAGASTPQTLYNIVHTEPDLSTLPDQVRRIVEPCLAQDPAARPTADQLLEIIGPLAPTARPWPDAVYATIATQASEISMFLSGAPTVVAPLNFAPSESTPAPEPARPARRRPVLIGTSAVAVAAVAVTALTLHGATGSLASRSGTSSGSGPSASVAATLASPQGSAAPASGAVTTPLPKSGSVVTTTVATKSAPGTTATASRPAVTTTTTTTSPPPTTTTAPSATPTTPPASPCPTAAQALAAATAVNGGMPADAVYDTSTSVCDSGWATGMIRSKSTGDARVVTKLNGGKWTGIVLGTDLCGDASGRAKIAPAPASVRHAAGCS